MSIGTNRQCLVTKVCFNPAVNRNNVCFIKNVTIHSGDTVLWIVTVFLKQMLGEAYLELVSKELNHFGVIAGLLRQIGGHSSRFVLFCSF